MKIFFLNTFEKIKQLIKYNYKKIIFKGTRYKCPFCNLSLKKLLPTGYDFPVLYKNKVIGGGLRDNALCPVCGSSDRERLAYLYLKKLNIDQYKSDLLHIAPEPNIKKFLAQQSNINYTTADISGVDVMMPMDITDIQYPDNHFDAIICNHVLEHIPDDDLAMRELQRVLKPKGWAILQVPFSLVLQHTYEDSTVSTDAEREHKFGQNDHVRIYSKDDYVKKLQKAGFKLELFEWWQEVDKYGKYALLQDEVLFLAKKV